MKDTSSIQSLIPCSICVPPPNSVHWKKPLKNVLLRMQVNIKSQSISRILFFQACIKKHFLLPADLWIGPRLIEADESIVGYYNKKYGTGFRFDRMKPMTTLKSGRYGSFAIFEDICIEYDYNYPKFEDENRSTVNAVKTMILAATGRCVIRIREPKLPKLQAFRFHTPLWIYVLGTREGEKREDLWQRQGKRVRVGRFGRGRFERCHPRWSKGGAEPRKDFQKDSSSLSGETVDRRVESINFLFLAFRTISVDRSSHFPRLNRALADPARPWLWFSVAHHHPDHVLCKEPSTTRNGIPQCTRRWFLFHVVLLRFF